jgi:hypothetical protein
MKFDETARAIASFKRRPAATKLGLMQRIAEAWLEGQRQAHTERK